MKCIKIKVVPTEGSDFQKLDLSIVEQTARTSCFGRGGRDSFTASNGFTLRSVGGPELSTSSLLYVKGAGLTADNRVVRIPTSLLPTIKQAVQEYNAYFATHPAAPKQDKCSVVIG